MEPNRRTIELAARQTMILVQTLDGEMLRSYTRSQREYDALIEEGLDPITASEDDLAVAAESYWEYDTFGRWIRFTTRPGERFSFTYPAAEPDEDPVPQ